MKLLQLILICAYFLYVFLIARKLKSRFAGVASLAIGLIIIALSVYNTRFLFQGIAPLLIAVGVAAGYISYVLSMFIVGVKFKRVNLLPFDCVRADKRICKRMGTELLHNVFTSTYEEFLFRGSIQCILQVITKTVFVAAPITIVLFTAVHYSDRKAIIQMIDLFVFAVILSVLYAVTGNIWLTAIVHILRNLFLIFYNYNTAYLRPKHNFSRFKNVGSVANGSDR